MSAAFEYCAHCGEKLPKDEWCPIVTTTDSDGTLQVHSFCDEDCEQAWRDDHPDESETGE